jgi:hypothetical protein
MCEFGKTEHTLENTCRKNELYYVPLAKEEDVLPEDEGKANSSLRVQEESFTSLKSNEKK